MADALRCLDLDLTRSSRRTGIRQLWTTRVTVLGPIMSKVLKVSDKIGGSP